MIKKVLIKKVLAKKTLSLILISLLIPIATFFFGIAQGSKWSQAQEDKTNRSSVISWDQARSNMENWGEMRYFFQGESFGTKDVLTAFAVIKPGESVHPAHRHAEEEYLVITKGSGTWHLNGKDFPAKEGDVMYIEPWGMHGLVNTSDQPLTFFVVRWTSKGVTPPLEPEGSHGR